MLNPLGEGYAIILPVLIGLHLKLKSVLFSTSICVDVRRVEYSYADFKDKEAAAVLERQHNRFVSTITPSHRSPLAVHDSARIIHPNASLALRELFAVCGSSMLSSVLWLYDHTSKASWSFFEAGRGLI